MKTTTEDARGLILNAARPRSSKDSNPSMILIHDEFVSREECARLKQIYLRYSKYATNKDYNFNPVLHYYDVTDRDPGSARLLLNVGVAVRDEVATCFGVATLFIESIFIACLWPGDLHTAHADNAKLVRRKWVPNHTAQRSHSGLLYINEGFSGGDLRFPERGLSVPPKPGRLVVFPSSKKFVHSVQRLRTGRRFSVPVWLTLDPKMEMTH
jgi:hypothetical protein